MRLPQELQEAIEQEIQIVDRRRLADAVVQLTDHYKAAQLSSPVFSNAAQRAAYLAVRLPATFAANVRVFSEVRRRISPEPIRSVLDLGAGPGTSLHAAAQVFSSLETATAVENDASLIELGRRLSAPNPHAAVRSADWVRQDLKSLPEFKRHDLVVISYALGELPQKEVERVFAAAWAAAGCVLAVIEPGTKRGFGLIRAARDWFIGSGAHILAPCPHAFDCPMAVAGDWCHFAGRLERTAIHRQLKGGSLGYEDEKFSYIAAGRAAFPLPAARIVRHPQKYTGHVQLTLCTPHGLNRPVITRSQREKYRQARKSEWGDEWD